MPSPREAGCAMLEREQRLKKITTPSRRTIRRDGELVRWYDREDHAHLTSAR